jgi:uncharacterized protein
MELVGVRVELPTNNPIVLLREVEGERRVLPIFIGGPEATAIAYALENLVPPRPQTHDLMKNVLEELGARVRRIEVTELVEHTFYAEIELETGGQVRRISSRPSDAIALAVRIGAQIFASEDVVAEFREFIESVNPEDFAS